MVGKGSNECFYCFIEYVLVDEQVARQQLGSTDFLVNTPLFTYKTVTMYIDAGVQSTATVLGLVMNQGRRQPPQGLPPKHWPRKKSGQGQRSILLGGFHWHCRYCLCGGCEGAVGLGHAKTSPQGRRKMVPGQIFAYSCCDGEEPAGLKTRPAW
jgi:hypothetical protein